jgi:hypothetical protein
MTRRKFVQGAAATAAAGLLGADAPFIDLFDGKTMDNWKPSENKASWKVRDGCLCADGPRSHLFYAGPVNNAEFKNFELEVECKAQHECNSGVYFHTRYQEKDFPIKGFEIQVNNTATGEGTYRERKKTASLYGIRNIYKQFVGDDEWFTLRVAVRGKNVQIRLNNMLMVDYVEPTPPIIPQAAETERFLDRGTFALQCHNQGSRAMFRKVRVRPLPDNLSTPGEPPVVDEIYRQILEIGRHNVPMVDYHVHLKEGLTLEQALAKSRRDGIEYGIAVNCGKLNPVETDAQALAYLDSMKGQPCFVAMQAEGREWTQMFSTRMAAKFDYIFTDSMTWTDNHGRRLRLWIPGELGEIRDKREFMDTLVDRTVGILEHEPVDIYVNPSYLPPTIAGEYDSLWTDERMNKVARAAAANQVAIELNDRYKIPSANFVRAAKAAGCKFTFGTNPSNPSELGRSEYGIKMIQECKLQWQDFFVPGAWGPKAIDRKPHVLL